jgi:hypothetical protein
MTACSHAVTPAMTYSNPYSKNLRQLGFVALESDRRGDLDRVGDAVTVVFGHHTDQLLEHVIRNGETGVSVWWHQWQFTVNMYKITVKIWL